MALFLAVLALAAAPALETGGHPAPHGGLVSAVGDGHLEFVLGPERLALFSLDAALRPSAPAGRARLLFPDGTDIPLPSSGDHWEAANPFGVGSPLTLVAIVTGPLGARSARFQFEPGQGSLFHDHRPFHGGQVGMAGERHLELALAAAQGGRSEWQLYLTDAYRQPVPMSGIRATLSVESRGSRQELRLTPTEDCLTAAVPSTEGPFDVHAHLVYPGDPEPVDMDFYFEAARKGPALGATTIRVTDGGFTPSRIDARAGEPLTLRFLRTSDRTCATRVVFSQLGIDRALPLGQPVEISIVPRRGEIDFACGMGMYRGAIVGS
ncbi:MAG: cupredoxin domain-containing protein [Deltaproteobacteria bacterium]